MLRLPRTLQRLYQRKGPHLAWHSCRLLWQDIDRTQLLAKASAMAYITLGSLVPSLAAIFAIISLFEPLADPKAHWFSTFRQFVLTNLAPDAGAQIVVYLERFLSNLNMTAIGVGGFAGLIFVLVLLMHSVEQTLDDIWLTSNVRHMLKRFLFFWTFLTLGSAMVTLALGYAAQNDWLPTLTQQSQEAGLNDGLASWLPLASSFMFFTFLYKIGPNCYVPLKAAAIGGFIAALLLRLANYAFSLYAVNADSYRSIYGALAAVPLFLLWLYLAWLVFLFGAIIAWRIQEGFTVDDRPSQQGSDEKTREPLAFHCQLQARALMPLICIVAAYERFAGNQGQLTTGRQLAHDLDLPASWVKEGLRVAEALGYVMLAKPLHSPEQEASDVLKLTILPLRPLASVSLRELISSFSEASRVWLKQRKLPSARNFESLLYAFGKACFDRQSKANLAELLEKGRPQPVREGQRASYRETP